MDWEESTRIVGKIHCNGYEKLNRGLTVDCAVVSLYKRTDGLAGGCRLCCCDSIQGVEMDLNNSSSDRRSCFFPPQQTPGCLCADVMNKCTAHPEYPKRHPKIPLLFLIPQSAPSTQTGKGNVPAHASISLFIFAISGTSPPATFALKSLSLLASLGSAFCTVLQSSMHS